MPSNIGLPSLECCLGTSSNQAAIWRPFSRLLASPKTQVPALPLSGMEEYPALEFAGSGNYGMEDNLDEPMGALLGDSSMGALLDDSGMSGVGEYEDVYFC